MAGTRHGQAALLADLAPEVEAYATQPGGGYKLLELLSLAGWRIGVIAGLAAPVLVIASKPGLPEVRKQGDSVADVAVDLYVEALAVSGRVPFPYTGS